MKITTNYSPRKATWLAFGLVAFAVITSAHEQDSGREESVAQTVFVSGTLWQFELAQT